MSGHFPPAVRNLYLLLYSLALLPAGTVAQPEQAVKIKVVVVEGDYAINNIRIGTAKEPVVRVEDEKGQPIAGALVTLVLPTVGAGASFPDGQKSLTVTTDEKGEAIGRGLRPNTLAGQFEIRVTASYQGQTVSVTLPQINVLPPAPAQLMPKKRGGAGKAILILVAAAGGGVGATIAAKRGGGKGTTQQPQPPIVVNLGSSTVGPP